jgi:hypothetical protein
MRRTLAQSAPPDLLLANPMIWWGFTRMLSLDWRRDAEMITELCAKTGIPQRLVLARLWTFVLRDDASNAVH